jgi:hypothetical protein
MGVTSRWKVAAGVLLAGCISSSAPDPADQVAGTVEGQITRADGSAVAGPGVSLALLTQPVGGQSRLLSQTSFVADAQGRFLIVFIMQRVEPQTAILAISASPPPGSGLLQRDSVGLAVRISRTIPTPDTAYIALALPAR